MNTHRSTITRYRDATASHVRLSGFRFILHSCGTKQDEEVASRCETVLNTTMAEMETYHTQKLEDFSAVTKEHLDGEIQFYEQVGFSDLPISLK